MPERPQQPDPDITPKPRVFPLFVPVLWFLGGPAPWTELTPRPRLAREPHIGFVLTALLVGIAGVVAISLL